VPPEEGAHERVDVVITEVGGTVGDIESLPFLEAARQVRHEIGRDNCFFLHISLVPYIAPSGELKTKPTQHSVAALRNIGIQPDALVCRSDREIGTGLKRKISLMCDVDAEGVISCPDAPSIYDIPKVLHREGLDAYVVRRLGLPFRDVDWTVWGDLLDRVHAPRQTVTIALVGKYIDLPDAYLSVTEALRAGGFAHRSRVQIRWVPSDDCATPEGAERALAGADGICIPGGFGVRGIEGKLGAIRHARVNGVPLLGPVPGPAVHGDRGGAQPGRAGEANSAEFDPDTPDAVIATMASQVDVVAGRGDMGGTMRLGSYPASPAEGLGRRRRLRRHGDHRAAPAPLRGGQRLPRPDRPGRAGLLRHLAGRSAGRVRRAAARGAPVLRRHPGPPGAQEPPDPAAPAVRGVRAGGDRLLRVRAAARAGRRGREGGDLVTEPARSPEGRAPTAIRTTSASEED
jgi:CTP synthase